MVTTNSQHHHAISMPRRDTTSMPADLPAREFR
jgi:hypothetical protein